MIPQRYHFKQRGVCEGGGFGFFSVPCFQDGRCVSRVGFFRQEVEMLRYGVPEQEVIHWKWGKQKGFLNWKEGVDSGVRN